MTLFAMKSPSPDHVSSLPPLEENTQNNDTSNNNNTSSNNKKKKKKSYMRDCGGYMCNADAARETVKEAQETVKELITTNTTLSSSSTYSSTTNPSSSSSSPHSVKTTTHKYDNLTEEQLIQPTPESDLSDPNRRIHIITTAALPWMTGTAVNPLLRALYLTRNRPSCYVTLVIPWLTRSIDRNKLYAPHTFVSQKEQIEHIRRWARDRCDMGKEADLLRIMFYPAEYRSNFGSIFPTCDICSVIANQEEQFMDIGNDDIKSKKMDVAVLEEPEHLNWINHCTIDTTTNNNNTSSSVDTLDTLGWTHKFRFVVGVIHTNYPAYAKMSAPGFGTGLILSPAISLLSALVVRAYCHKVIRLSPVLPVYAPGKETTCNVHGVRSEFLPTTHDHDVDDCDDENENGGKVYFIGKLLWAKGFDKMLEIEDHFRQVTGDYFPIDVYGAGPDEVSITRAFRGRLPDAASSSNPTTPLLLEEDNKSCHSSIPVPSSKSNSDLVLNSNLSIRSQLEQSQSSTNDTLNNSSTPKTNDTTNTNSNMYSKTNPLSILNDLSAKSIDTGIEASNAMYNLADHVIRAGLTMTFRPTTPPQLDQPPSSSQPPQDASTTNNILSPIHNKIKNNIQFDPPTSRFEFRRYPIPSNFLGVIDHAQLLTKNHKIFFNPSISEVLCTTTAEALAMGKFAIIPNHPSNEFFIRTISHPNCLSYNSVGEAVEQLRYALIHPPTPVTNRQAEQEWMRVFTWEAATERFIKASVVTKREQRMREELEEDKMDQRIAWLHCESGKKGERLRTLFGVGGAAGVVVENEEDGVAEDGIVS